MGDLFEKGKPLTKAGLFQLVADEVMRDGRVVPEENRLLNGLAKLLRLTPEIAIRIARYSKKKHEEGALPPSCPVEPLALYEKVLEYVLSDGVTDELEKAMLKGLRLLLHVSDEVHETLVVKVTAQRAAGAAAAAGKQPESAPDVQPGGQADAPAGVAMPPSGAGMGAIAAPVDGLTPPASDTALSRSGASLPPPSGAVPAPVALPEPIAPWKAFLGLAVLLAIVVVPLSMWGLGPDRGGSGAGATSLPDATSSPAGGVTTAAPRVPSGSPAPGAPPSWSWTYRDRAEEGEPFESSVGMKLAWIEPGRFSMGSPADERGRYEREGPQREVNFSHGFWVGVFEVTQEEYLAVQGINPSAERSEGAPVTKVSWYDALEFCVKLTHRDRQAGRLNADFLFTLPSSAMWEFVCRAGTETPFSFGETITADQVAFDGASASGDSLSGPVARGTLLSANAWGLCNMHGNVQEWCLDTTLRDYRHVPMDGLRWFETLLKRFEGVGGPSASRPDEDVDRIIRGGAWSSPMAECRSAFRDDLPPGERSGRVGFRVVLIRKRR